ncbi:MAG: hypothetical protein KDC13_04235 [Bacteroidetes bacterium]|nr:hypothetical protein [Bacteroidota bacterium]
MIKRNSLVLLAFPIVLGLSGCSMKDAVMCDESAVAGLNIYVNDAVSFYPVIQNVKVEAISQNGSEILENPISEGSPFIGAFEKPGVYTIIVTHPEYRNDTIFPVIVEKGRCHVTPEVVYSRLRKN